MMIMIIIQWEFKDPKMEVLYHIRPYFVDTKALYHLTSSYIYRPYIGLI